MNIFKILDTGDGRINEPNLSAFLGYLLNPREDHGLNDAFLKKVIEPFLEIKGDSNPIKKLFSHTNILDNEQPYILDLGVNTHFSVEVVLEKAFKRNDKSKEIVDIFIKISKRKKGGNEDVSYLFNKSEEPVALILVENKIDHNNSVISQLKAQYDASSNYLPELIMVEEERRSWEKNICTILIAPYQIDLENEFETFKKDKPNSIYLSWNDSIGNIKSITQSVLEVLNDHETGEIAPIPSYTADTLRAFINYIKNDFSSDVEDQQKGGETRKKEWVLGNDILKELNHLPFTLQQQFKYIKELLQKYEDDNSLILRYSPRTKHLSYAFTPTGRDVALKFIFSTDKIKLLLPEAHVLEWNKSDTKWREKYFTNLEEIVGYHKLILESVEKSLNDRK